MKTSQILDSLFAALPELHALHAPTSSVYTLMKQVARQTMVALFSESGSAEGDFGPFGKLIFPYHQMGAIDSVNLFDLDELIMFSFYWLNRNRYKRVLDIGANLGLHSIIMSKCGFEVRAYEPDPHHYDVLLMNLELNQADSVTPNNMAVSSQPGELEFVRVLGNTTSSHLAGSKANPYGDLERIPVKVEAIGELLNWADLVKMDAEGHEKEILLATARDHWMSTDALVEIENENNAEAVFDHMTQLDMNLFSQKQNWQRVSGLDDMPTSYRDGTLFISTKSEMPW